MLNVVLFEPEIPQNTGNIIRTCMATNTRLHLIEPLGFSLDEKAIKRSAMDYINDMEYKVYKNWDEFYFKNPGKYLFVTRYAKTPHSDYKFSNDDEEIYLVFGKESTGIDKNILNDHPDKLARIPMISNARSLNLSNSVAIVVYEVLRQLGYPDLATHEVLKGEDFLDEIKSAR